MVAAIEMSSIALRRGGSFDTASDQRTAGGSSDGPTASWVEVVATVVLALAGCANLAARRSAL
jgi:hypothetical protein